MERLNLNLPSDARKELKRLAVRAKRRESELARELLLKAIEEERLEEFYRGVAAAQTPERRKRDLEVAEAFERLLG